MARRASSGVNSQALLIGAAVLALILGGGYWFITRTPDGFAAPPLDIARDIDHYRSLAGNENSITGTLFRRPPTDSGQMATLKVGVDDYLFIIIPPDFKGGNLNLQDEYTFLVKFNTDGIPIALDVKQL